MSTSAITSPTDSGLLTNYINSQASTVAASSASSSSASSGIAGNETTFLKILTTQLKYQDPTAATDTNQFTQELVQFTQAEQQINTNTKLDTLISLQKGSSGATAALGYIGKYVEITTDNQLPLQKSQSELAYTLPKDAQSVVITVQDSTGKTVAKLNGLTAKGLDRVAWDGKDSSGTVLADGAYTFNLAATDSDGKAITITDTRAVGYVTAVNSNSDGTSNVSMGPNMSVPSSTIDAVYDSNNLPTGTLGDTSS